MVDFCAISSLRLLQIKLLRKIHTQILLQICAFVSLRSISRNMFVRSKGSICLWEITKWFPKWLYYFGFPSPMCERSSSISYRCLELPILLIWAPIVALQWYLIMAVICIYPTRNDAEHCNSYVIFGEVSVQTFCQLFNFVLP